MILNVSKLNIFLTGEYPCCSLLRPIGEYRSLHVCPSKGKRKKRKRQEDSTVDNNRDQKSFAERDLGSSKAEGPAIQEYLTIGFNSITRHLEALAKGSAPETVPGQFNAASNAATSKESATNSNDLRSLVAVFVARHDQPLSMHSHLPLLIKATSIASPYLPCPRLVTLPKAAQQRLSTALAIPRVGLIGLIHGAPRTETLVDIIRHKVPEVEVPWLDEEAKGGYLPVNIKATASGVASNAKIEDSLETLPVAEN